MDLIKLDVDGNEFPILYGACDVLERSRPMLLVEAGAWHFEDPARNPFNLLQRLHYRFWDMKSLVEYPDLDALRQLLPPHDDATTVSLNVLAALQLPEA